ncbi:MAG: beta-phosphoglucomutase [Oscillospiraceae bacterium]|nr:beta-phosphoglucomutase [Oscillospiraceae bacterium]
MANAIIFDLDGVIVHTDVYHFRAWKELAERLGIPFSEADNNRLRGVSRMESLEIILEKGTPGQQNLTKDEKKALASEKNETYKKLLQSMTPDDVTDEVRDTLNALRAKGHKLAIGSSSCNAKLILDKVGLGTFFDAISDGNNITNSKPDPEVFLKAAEYLGASPSNSIIVEDADAGVEAGKRAGMQTIAIGDAVLHGNADHNIESFSGILDVLEQM